MYGQLLFCVLGIYIFFLTWGILQERISTQVYLDPLTGAKGKFAYFVFLNLVQNVAAMLTSLFSCLVQGIRITSSGPDKPMCWALFLEYLKAALSSATASPFGYMSLRYINFPTMILGKSCKLLPVMLMNVLIYRKRFERQKYLTVLLITIGVSGFMFFEEGKHGAGSHGKKSSVAGNSFLGLGLLLGNLLLDGITNSLQDRIFLNYRLKAQHMMFYMSSISAALYLLWLTCWPTGQLELTSALSFLRQFPSSILDVAMFAFCGAMGQNFIYYTLQTFGSLSLVTVTVTRKLFTILLSLFYFNHRLNWKQWVAVVFVFIALLLESFGKRKHASTQHTGKKASVEGKQKETSSLLSEIDTSIAESSSDSRVIGVAVRPSGLTQRKH